MAIGHTMTSAMNIAIRQTLWKPAELCRINYKISRSLLTCSYHKYETVGKRAAPYDFLSQGWRQSTKCPLGIWRWHRQLHLPSPFARNQDYGRIDKLPTNFDLVYHSTVNIYICYGYPFAMLTWSAVPLVFLASLLIEPGNPVPIDDIEFGTFESLMQLAVAGPLMGCLAYLSWVVARKTPLRIYYDEDKRDFTAIFATLLPWKVEKLNFKAGDIKELRPALHEEETDPNLVTSTWVLFRGRYILGKRRLTIIPHHFRYPVYYNVIMGYVTDDPFTNDPEDDF